MTSELGAAYASCRAIARQRAKNFYYAFIVLPRNKRNAICAVYAFMRHADDLSDDETLPVAERRAKLGHWLNLWHEALAGSPTSDPVFIALRDVQKQFAIAPQLFDQLVEGTAADLISAANSGPNQLSTFPAFSDLYSYCYLVASVVGLVCIRIFGYRDARAEKLAEETGIAFQLTNILRDVREDADRGRLYLPLEDLDLCGVNPEQIVHRAPGVLITSNQRDVLAMQAARAQKFYQASEQLLPLISPDSRPALWVLVTIYQRLLRRIEQCDFDVFSRRVKVPDYQKLIILGIGVFRAIFNRMLPAKASS